VGDIVTFHQERGLERTWVPRDEESWWIAFWGKGGVPAARWKDYLRWGRQFYDPAPDDVISGSASLRRTPRKHTNYARWTPPR
jgi:hypothetical protein